MHATRELLTQALQKQFGLTGFRAGQREALEHLLARQHVLVVMPTGSGKSLIYQLYALTHPGTTVVISPLIALMKDQVDRLQAQGIAAAFINSTISPEEQQRRLQAMQQGAYKLVYVAPERLRNASFLAALRQTPLALLAVDEAHCISQWGHDFRPDYLYLSEVRQLLGNPLTIALTATATPEVQQDILEHLQIPHAARVVTGFQRPNLIFHARLTPDAGAKLRELRRLLNVVRGQAGIVYVGTRNEAVELGRTLRERLNVPAYVYHGGMESPERAHAQESWLCDPAGVMVATNAFGMGVDRPDVRFVVHYTIPGSLEAYYQEAGRAGRDGRLAQCVLLYAPQDRHLQEWFIENDTPSLKTLCALHTMLHERATNHIATISPERAMSTLRLSESQLRVGLSHLEQVGALLRLHDDPRNLRCEVRALDEDMLNAIQERLARWRNYKRAQLEKMIAYAETTDRCRQQMLLEHFGDHTPVRARPCCDFHIRIARGIPHPSFRVARDPDAAKDKTPSLEITAQLFAQGLSLEEVAAQRGLARSTIYVHAAQLIAQGRLALDRVVSAPLSSLIQEAAAKASTLEHVAAVKALLPSSVEYGAIRCVLAHLRRGGN
ncbi:MAG: RecQ family ATP-dependent DNA helicase [Thermoflexales bacterium]